MITVEKERMHFAPKIIQITRGKKMSINNQYLTRRHSIKQRVMQENISVARRGAHLAAERGGAERRQGARRSVAVPNGEGVAAGSATLNFPDK